MSAFLAGETRDQLPEHQKDRRRNRAAVGVPFTSVSPRPSGWAAGGLSLLENARPATRKPNEPRAQSAPGRTAPGGFGDPVPAQICRFRRRQVIVVRAWTRQFGGGGTADRKST